MNSKVSKFDILDHLWDMHENLVKSMQEKNYENSILHRFLKDISRTTWAIITARSKFPDVPEYLIECAIECFQYEQKYLFHKPNRETMSWMFGEHASLYDVFGCKIHHLTITTHDDERFIDGQTIFCPKCNEKILNKEINFDDYSDITSSKELWEFILGQEKFYKQYYRKLAVEEFFNNLLRRK